MHLFLQHHIAYTGHYVWWERTSNIPAKWSRYWWSVKKDQNILMDPKIYSPRQELGCVIASNMGTLFLSQRWALLFWCAVSNLLVSICCWSNNQFADERCQETHVTSLQYLGSPRPRFGSTKSPVKPSRDVLMCHWAVVADCQDNFPIDSDYEGNWLI